MSEPADTPDGTRPGAVVRSQERLLVSREWVAVERVRIRRRLVTEELLVPVTIRREELVIEQEPAAEPLRALPGGAWPPSRAPLVITLHEEVPVVTLASRPYEQVTLTVEVVGREQDVTVELAGERVVIETDLPARP